MKKNLHFNSAVLQFKQNFLSAAMLISAACLIISCNKELGKKESLKQGTDQQSNTSRRNSLKPNIIIVLVDDVGYEIPNYTGGQSYQTPNINRMAENGMQFTQCHASPLCSPSRCMLLTGKYNFRNYTAWGKLDTSQHTIANMLKDAGYATCVSGKWQLDGGEKSIHAFGFDEYMVWDPYYHTGKGRGDELADGQYKNPKIYANGSFLPDNVISGKYGEDFFREYAFDFIDNNLNDPFFLYWTPNLCHKNFCPTPDDRGFASWVNRQKQSGDSIYFPSMVKYMDKEIGLLLDKLDAAGIAQKTVVLFMGDNGTVDDIHSLFDNNVIRGAKGQSIIYGTHVPLIAYCPGKIAAGSKSTSLIDFTDFLPTVADIANIQKPTNYGSLDGVSFAPDLLKRPGKSRDWVYCYYYPHPEKDTTWHGQWVNDNKFKVYEDGRVYNYSNDPLEVNPIPDGKLTAEEKRVKYKAIEKMNRISPW